MQFSIFDCEDFSKKIKKDLDKQEQEYFLTDLYLDPGSRRKYLDKLTRTKTQQIGVWLKRREVMREVLPVRHHAYVDKVMKYIENGSLATR